MTRVRQPEGEVFGRRLRELREKNGVTQNALAAASGLTEAYISNMENGFAVRASRLCSASPSRWTAR